MKIQWAGPHLHAVLDQLDGLQGGDGLLLLVVAADVVAAAVVGREAGGQGPGVWCCANEQLVQAGMQAKRDDRPRGQAGSKQQAARNRAQCRNAQQAGAPAAAAGGAANGGRHWQVAGGGLAGDRGRCHKGCSRGAGAWGRAGSRLQRQHTTLVATALWQHPGLQLGL